MAPQVAGTRLQIIQSRVVHRLAPRFVRISRGLGTSIALLVGTGCRWGYGVLDMSTTEGGSTSVPVGGRNASSIGGGTAGASAGGRNTTIVNVGGAAGARSTGTGGTSGTSSCGGTSSCR